MFLFHPLCMTAVVESAHLNPSFCISFMCQCIASNFIGFFLYIAAGSVVVWSYTFEIDEGQEYREGA